MCRVRPNRISHRNPAISADLIHDEGVIRGRKEKALVSEQRQCRYSVRRCRNNIGDARQIVLRRFCRFKRCWPQQADQSQAGDCQGE